MLRTPVKLLCLMIIAQFGYVYGVDLEKIAKDLVITYDVDRHNPPDHVYGHSFLANVSLLNGGTTEIPASGWSVFFCHKPLIQPLYYNSSAGQYIGGGLILSGNITLTHVKGCLFKFEPYNGKNMDYVSQPLLPGETRNISFLASNTAVTAFDVFPYWYVANDTHTSTIISTAGDFPSFVAPHSTFLKWQRSVPTDLYGTPLGLWNRFRGLNFTDAKSTKYAILPTPKRYSVGTKTVTVDNKWTIDRDRDGRLIGVANYLQKSIKGSTIRNKKRSAKKIIQLYIRRNRPANESGETYRLRVKPDRQRIEIGGNSVHGVFNGIQTLFSLLAFDGTLAEINITDSPRFGYRGVDLDVASNFVPKSTIMKLLNVMALYKLNKLQLRLANNEGWRIEIPEVPELTQIGGQRCHDLTETACLLSQWGSGPGNFTMGSGYYTVQDYVDIVRAAKQRQIEVIPAINMAGKARAAIVAMKSYEKRTGDVSMRIYDERDQPNTRYMTEDLYNDAAINPCIPTVDAFFNKTLRKLIEYHARAKAPLKSINVGGNDSPPASRINSSYCAVLGLPGPDPFMFMKVNYTTRLASIASQSDINLSGMEEFFSAWPTNDDRGGILVPFSRTRFPSNIDISPIAANSYDPLTFQRAQVMANVGYKVILSPSDYFSLDHAPEPDPEIPGDYWAIRHIQPARVFNYLPDNRCCNLNPDEFRYGKFTINGCIDLADCVKLEKPENILGMLAQVRTKKIRNEDQLFGLMFPRLLVFAERAWHKADWESSYVSKQNRTSPFISPDVYQQQKDWVRFSSIVGHKELKRLEAYGIKHRIPPPGVQIDAEYVDPFDGKNKTVLLTDTAYPGLVPQVYGANKKWSDLGPITDISNLTASTLTFRTRNAANNRYSIMETMDPMVPNVYMAQLLASGIIMTGTSPPTQPTGPNNAAPPAGPSAPQQQMTASGLRRQMPASGMVQNQMNRQTNNNMMQNSNPVRG